jgi:purine nucleoside permease
MMIRKMTNGPFRERARRSAPEITLAVILTLAAVIFVVAAIRGTTPETASISAAPVGNETSPN